MRQEITDLADAGSYDQCEPFDICLVQDPADHLWEATRSSLLKLARNDGGRAYALGLIGDSSVGVEMVPDNVTVFRVPESGATAQSQVFPVGRFVDLIRRAFLEKGPDRKVDLLRKLCLLLFESGGSFDSTAVWNDPRVVQVFVSLHKAAGRQEPFVEWMWEANEWMEVLCQRMIQAKNLPEAKLYHCLSANHTALVAAVAAEAHEGELICNRNFNGFPRNLECLLPSADGCPSFGADFRSSFCELVQELIEDSTDLMIVPALHLCPRWETGEKPKVDCSFIPPRVEVIDRDQWEGRRHGITRIRIGWIVDHLSTECISRLADLIEDLELDYQFEFTLLESCPSGRSDPSDVAEWISEQPWSSRLTVRSGRFRPSQLDDQDLLIKTGEDDESHWAMIQGMARGLPILALRQPVDEHLEGGGALQLVDSLESDGALEVLTDWIENTDLRREQGEKALQSAERKFSTARTEEIYAHIYSRAFSRIGGDVSGLWKLDGARPVDCPRRYPGRPFLSSISTRRGGGRRMPKQRTMRPRRKRRYL
ncbi:MAG: DUF3492 domain-containing protein [Verrucomicrobiota bacterium]